MAEGDSNVQAVDPKSLEYALALGGATSQPNIPAQSNAPMPAPPDVGQDQPQQAPPVMPRPAAPQAGPPQMGGLPLIAQYLSGMIHGGQGGVNPQTGQPTAPTTRGDMTLNFLGQFLSNMAQGLAQSGHGPGANLRGLAGGMMAPYQRELAQYQLGQQQQAQQAQIEAEQARTQAQLQSYTSTPRFDPISGQYLGPMTPGQFTQYIRGQAAAKERGQTAQDINKANIVSREKIAGENVASREKIAGEQAETKQKSLDEKSEEFKQTLGYKQWKEKLDKDTQLKVAEMTAGKAPGGMLATASYAQGALEEMAHAQAAMQRLEAKGVMGSIPSNQVEDLLFGKGLVDPRLDAETRKDIGALRAALGYTSTALMRTHTGRTSVEIYKDFKNRLGPGQDWSALRGAIDETTSLAQHYVDSASTANIQNIRQGNAVPPTPKKGEKPPLDSFWKK